MTGAIVIGSDYRALGVVRSLGRHGVPVWVLRDNHAVAAASRYVRQSRPLPEPLEDHFIDLLLDLATTQHLEGWLLIPSLDESLPLLAQNYALLSQHFRLATQPWDVIRWMYDKRLTYQLAHDLGIAAPWTAYPADRAALDALDCVYPVILKPATKPGLNRFTVDKAWQVENAGELRARYDEATTLIDPALIMVQEIIPGGGENQYSYAALCDDGVPLAGLVARRTRQFPMDFGRASTYVETVEAPEIEAAACRLLGALHYTGIVEVEFKQDACDGQYKLLDVNARVWGWITLGCRAGIDFPYLLWRLLQGESIAPLRAPAGIRWIRMLTDIPTVASELRHRRLTPGEYLRSLRGPLEFAVFASDDPLPALVELPTLPRLILGRGWI